MNRVVRLSAAVMVAAAAACATGGDDLWRHRNLGKAFYENPSTSREAVEEFRQALALAPRSARERVNYGLALVRAGRVDDGAAELERAQQADPSIPHTWFNLGILYKQRGDVPRAIGQFERMAALVETDAVTRFNLGYLYARSGRTADAIAQLTRAAALDRHFAAPHFQLASIYRAAGPGQAALAAREQTLFEEARYRRSRIATPENVDWGPYSEVIDDLPPAHTAPAPPARFRDDVVDAGAVDGPTAGLAVLDVNGDGRPDLVVWSRAGVALLDRGRTRIAAPELAALAGVTAVAPGDFDNDGRVDLCVLTRREILLFRNRGGSFERVAAPALAGASTSALWIDYDHDYDLDLLLVGERTRLVRNNGTAGFADAVDGLPAVGGRSLDAVVFDVEPDTPGHDVIVTYADRPAVLFRDRLAGTYEAEVLPAIPEGARHLAARDLDADGRTDVTVGAPAPIVLFNRPSGFAAQPVATGATPVPPVDLSGTGVAGLVPGALPVRRAGPGAGDATLEPAAGAVADFDRDGRIELAAVGIDGRVHLLSSESSASGRAMRIRLEGVKNLALASQARVEVRAGALYQKQIYAGVPLVFGLGRAARVDAVRITWPNGLIQSESRPASLDVTYKEALRLSGSCPMVFTWNGRGFEFVTDVLGVAPLGASAGDGEVFPVDHDEYVQIPPGALVSRAGGFDVRITEELHEVSYLDRVQLVAADRPAGVRLVSNEKFKSPPFPEFRLFHGEAAVPPVAARTGGGRDVRDRLVRRDGRYPDDFARDLSGVAELHDLFLDFGDAAPDNRAVLILTGWVDWADGSTFKAVAQSRPRGFTMPSLAVKDASGQWRTVLDDMGFPAGKPKTIAVDLTGLFLSRSREIRIRTDLCVYWDEIRLSGNPDPPPVHLHALDPALATLRFRGFSRPRIDPARLEPESFRYDERILSSSWNPVPGMYTRYGDVTPLMRQADDRFAILGSGDELQLRFSPEALPPLARGWERDFFLLVDGWAKDSDPNTAFSQSVEPLPFHGMSGYPYGPHERYPDDPRHEAYRRTYNTRPALTLLAPLAPRRPPP